MASDFFNFNVGILGHVDSGKTSLAKALSTVASTASFDKNPQSQERGITLDLGFSSFSVETPAKLIDRDSSFEAYSKIQYTLVDCPGHASLFKTVIGGAQIIDLVLLVIDCQKGVQTQTAECLILAEITCPNHMIVVLNKIDLFDDDDGDDRRKSIDKITRRLRKTLESTVFKNAPIVPVSCLNSSSVQPLIDAIVDLTYRPLRNRVNGPFVFAVDHCFGMKGQGTVMTGTVLSGTVKLNDMLEIPSLKETRKVKSMQIFRRPVALARQGDRVALCVAQFDARALERGVVCKPGVLTPAYAALIRPRFVRHFRQNLASDGAKLHVTIGHETTLARCTFFRTVDEPPKLPDPEPFNRPMPDPAPYDRPGPGPDQLDRPVPDPEPFDFDREYAYVDKVYDKDAPDQSNDELKRNIYGLLEFDHPVLCPAHCLYVASKLDMDQQSNACRLAFYGHLLLAFHDKNYSKTELEKLKVFKSKAREGVVERMIDQYGVIATGLFKKQTNIDAFLNLKVSLSGGETGVIEGHFGQSGKAKIRILNSGLSEETMALLQRKLDSKKKSLAQKKDNVEVSNNNNNNNIENRQIKIVLRFKRFIYDQKKNMVQ